MSKPEKKPKTQLVTLVDCRSAKMMADLSARLRRARIEFAVDGTRIKVKKADSKRADAVLNATADAGKSDLLAFLTGK